MPGKHPSLCIKISCNKTSWVRFKTTWCYCRKQGWNCPGVSLKPPCFVVRLPLKNIWFRHRKHRWKYPEFLLRISCFVATNAAEDGSTSCEKYLISAVNVRSFPKKNMLTNAPPKKGPFCSIVTYKFKMFGLNISLVVKPRSAAESSLSEGVTKKRCFWQPRIYLGGDNQYIRG